MLARIVVALARRPLPTVLVGMVLGALCVWLAVARLGVTTDTDTLFAASLPWKQREAELKRLFPQDGDLLVAVIDAASPEEADATAAGLAQAMTAEPKQFAAVRRPDSSPYFDQNGLLLLDRPVLEGLLNQTIDAQPFLGQLAADPSLRGLCAALSLLGMGVERGEDLSSFDGPLRGFHTALADAAAGHPTPLSWQKLLAGPVAELGGPYRFVLTQPIQDYGALQPGAAATDRLRALAAQQEFVQAGRAHVRVTGSVALADEEFATVAQGALAGLIGSLVLVIVWLVLAVRTWRVVVPIVLTLLLGLLLTTGFATLTSSPLNLISVAFAILFVGIAVDFAIQFSVRFREAQRDEAGILAALRQTARRAGAQILVAAAATASGFLAFVPTDFVGVAELGWIAGIGMLIAFGTTLLYLPACLALFQPSVAVAEIGFRWAAPLDAALHRARWPVLALFAVLAVLGAAGVPRLVFDSDPLHTKDPSTEAMRTLADLAANPLTNPYTIDVLRPGAAAAAALAAEASKLPLVSQAITLTSFVPEDQAAKLALIRDAASLLGPTLAPRPPASPVTAADIRLGVRTALAQLNRAAVKLPPQHPLNLITQDLRALATTTDIALVAANAALTRFLPLQLQRLRTSLSAKPVTLASIPPALARDWQLPDGRVRVQIAAKPDAAAAAGLRQFVAQVQTIAPDAGGSAVTIVSTADTIITAFTRAALGAVLAITVILALALRRVRDVLLVLAPLLLSSLLTVLAAVLLPLPLNFANIIALPLLLGVGVSFNIYFVMNWRIGVRDQLASPTARAVAFSALTTGTAFGSLALSRHPGTASMGVLLLLSLGCTLIASLIFIPALLATMSSSGPDTVS